MSQTPGRRADRGRVGVNITVGTRPPACSTEPVRDHPGGGRSISRNRPPVGHHEPNTTTSPEAASLPGPAAGRVWIRRRRSRHDQLASSRSRSPKSTASASGRRRTPSRTPDDSTAAVRSQATSRPASRSIPSQGWRDVDPGSTVTIYFSAGLHGHHDAARAIRPTRTPEDQAPPDATEQPTPRPRPRLRPHPNPRDQASPEPARVARMKEPVTRTTRRV